MIPWALFQPYCTKHAHRHRIRWFKCVMVYSNDTKSIKNIQYYRKLGASGRKLTLGNFWESSICKRAGYETMRIEEK